MKATPPLQTEADRWLHDAQSDYRLCREFDRLYDTCLSSSHPGGRVGWEVFGHVHCALRLPESLIDGGAEDAWYLYYVAGESLFRRDAAQRAQMDMLVLPESADDWAELLRRALSADVFDVRWTLTPDYINALGETELMSSGFLFTLEAYAPGAACVSPYRVGGCGSTPVEAARNACRRWLGRESDNEGEL